MKKAADSGTIEKGKRGDLIVLDGNPLDDIRNTRRIYRVVTNGRVFDPAPLWRSVGFQPVSVPPSGGFESGWPDYVRSSRAVRASGRTAGRAPPA